MANLHPELIEDILRRLPVKSLKRFRAVAKSWCIVIDSDRFAKKHLRHSLTSLSNRHLITGGAGVYTGPLDSLGKDLHAINPPFNFYSCDEISHSCNGIILVTSNPPVLWNPFSGDYKILPDSPVDFAAPGESHYTKIGYDFGYDSRNDDYKVVRVLEFGHKTTYAWLGKETEIYSFKSNSWKKIDPLPDQPLILSWDWLMPGLNGRAHVNGVLHTLVEDSDNVDGARIVCFSLETEKLYPMTMPPEIKIRSFDDVRLDVTGDYLSVVCTNRDWVVIWVMKEYGVVESWVKLLSVGELTYKRRVFVKPLVYSQEGDRVLLSCNDKRLVGII